MNSTIKKLKWPDSQLEKASKKVILSLSGGGQ